MIENSYASTSRDSQWTTLAAAGGHARSDEDRARARNPLYLRAVADKEILTAEAGSATIESLAGDRDRRAGRLKSSRPSSSLPAFTYSFHLGTDALGASEAYSAWAAAKPGVGAIVRTPVLHDPGKQLLYYVVLHYYTRIFGLSEISLRSMSVIFSLMTLVLVFALGCEMFDEHAALAAAAIWAFNPLAVVFAHTARMYPMFSAIALAHLLTLWRVRSRPSVIGAIGCGILGAAMPYTHLSGLLILGAEAAILLRDFARGRRDTLAWMAIALAIGLFIPYVPVAIRQSQGTGLRALAGLPGSAIQLPAGSQNSGCAGRRRIYFVAGARPCGGTRQQRTDSAAGCLDRIAGAGIHRRFRDPASDVQSTLPCAGNGGVVVVGCGVDRRVEHQVAQPAGRRLRAGMLDHAAVRTLPAAAVARPGRAGGGRRSSDPVFFEAGFVSNEDTATVANGGFPFGYYSVPFDYYFAGANPRIAIPGFDSAAARMTIEERVSAAGGGWLVSWKDSGAVNSELPDPKRFRVVEKYRIEYLAIYRITPAAK